MEVRALLLLRAMLQETWRAGKGPRFAVIMTTNMGLGHARQLR